MHKFLFYTLMCRNYLEIGKNTKGDLLEKDSDFPEICPQTVFRDRQFDPSKTTSIEDEYGYKVVGHFHSFLFKPKNSPIRVRMRHVDPFYCRINI